MRYYILLVISCTISLGFAQEITVVDPQNNPIPNVAAFNSLKTKSSLSSTDGTINLSRFSPKDTLFFQHPNYEILKIEKASIGPTIILNLNLNMLDVIEVKETKNTDNIKNTAEKKIYISLSEISGLGGGTTADLLEKKGGVSVQKSQVGGGSPNIRGFEANKVLLIVDGVRLNNTIYRSGHLQNIITVDENMLDNIEIIFGPSSVLYGSDALGGTIHMKTKNLFFHPNHIFSGSILSRYNSSYQGITSNITTSFSSPKYSTITSVSLKSFGDVKMGSWRPHGYDDWGLVYHYVDKNDSIVCNNDPEIQQGTGYQQYDFFNKMMFKVSDRVRITSNLQYSTSSNIPRFDKLNDGDSPCIIETTGLCSNTHSLKFHSYYYGPQERFFSSLRLSMFDYYFDSSDVILGYQKIKESRHKWYMDDFLDYLEDENNYDPPMHQYETVNAYSINTNMKKGPITLGTETIYNDVVSTSDTNNENLWGLGDTRYPPEGSNAFSTAFYCNVLQRISNKLQLEYGGRYTYSTIEGAYPDSMNRPLAGVEGLQLNTKNHILSGNIKLTYYPNDSWKISSVTARGFHAPNVDDMLKVFKKGAIITIPNINLKPEYSISQEITITKNINSQFLLYGVGFYSHITDAIVKDSISVNINPVEGGEPLLSNMLFYDDEWVYTFANQNSSEGMHIYGATFGFNLSTAGLDINADFNITKGINPSLSAGPVAHIPPNFGKLEILKKIRNIELRLLLLYAGEKRPEDFDEAGTDNLNETPIIGQSIETGLDLFAGAPSWYTLNFYVDYKLSKSINLYLGVENIMDMHYKTFGSGVSAPGRNFMFSARYSF